MQITAVALVHVSDRAVYLYVTAVYEAQEDIAWARASLKAWRDSVVAANRTNMSTDRPSTTEASHAESQSQLTQYAILMPSLFVAWLLGSLLYAVLLQLGTKWVMKTAPSYKSAYATCLMFIGATLALGLVAVLLDSNATHIPGCILLPIGFVVQAAIIWHRLDTDFGKAAAVALFLYLPVVIGIIVAVVILGLAF